MSSAETSKGGSRVIMWCVPRTISSALTKCLSAVQDLEVHFEPYQYCFAAAAAHKASCGEDIPMMYEGNEEALAEAAQFVSTAAGSRVEPKRLAYGSVKEMLETATSKHVFVKDMGAGMVPSNALQYIPKGYKHTFLIRDPIRSISSYRQAMYTQFLQLGLLEGESADERTYDIERDDKFFPPGCFMKELYDVWKYVRQHIDNDPIVIDADDFLAKPAEVLNAYCAAVGIPYSESLLKWDASMESLKTWKAAGDSLVFDLRNFYGRAMRSSEFLPPSKFPEQLTPDVIRCSDKVKVYFEEMYGNRLRI
ncbi:uncharacterized protein [Diadema antillarum]|uniref:uncharacterized protein n=1 Tax=Diadema antillarum TaxID=105358 RepID=UPI003A85844C